MNRTQKLMAGVAAAMAMFGSRDVLLAAGALDARRLDPPHSRGRRSRGRVSVESDARRRRDGPTHSKFGERFRHTRDPAREGIGGRFATRIRHIRDARSCYSRSITALKVQELQPSQLLESRAHPSPRGYNIGRV